MVDHNSTEQREQEEVLQVASFYLDNTLCGINIKDVQEIKEDLNVTKVPLSSDYIMGIMNLRGQIVTIVNVGMKIGLAPSIVGPESRVVIVESKGEHIGLLVDKVMEVIAISPKKVSAPPANIKGAQGRFFQGILNTEDHELMALLNIEDVLADENWVEEAIPEKRFS